MVSKPVVPHRKRNILRVVIILLLIVPLFFGWITPPPEGTSYMSQASTVSDIQLIYDLTFMKDEALIHDQSILDEQIKMIQEAEEFIVADLFLYNDYYNTEEYQFPDSTQKLTDALIAQKEKHKDLIAYLITDQINNSYGTTLTKQFQLLEENGIQVIVTDLNKVRDSNPLYSGYYRTYIKPFGLAGKGWIKNPFGDNGPKVSIRNYLKLLNFKANHRKVFITDKGAMVSSSNPHDGSAYHSNIAFQYSGEAVKYLLEAEKAVALFSGTQLKDVEYKYDPSKIRQNTEVLVLTEDKIKEKVLESIENTQAGDKIDLGMFYLSHREIVKKLIEASSRGVNIRIVLDPNKDAFGYEKNGIPNRQTAAELTKKSEGKIQIRWYLTHGEQYHTKMLSVTRKEEVILIGGSANYTRRNLDNYNLEADLMVIVKNDDSLAKEYEAYFNRIWSNQDGVYTADYSEYEDDSLWKELVYKLQEQTGLSTF